MRGRGRQNRYVSEEKKVLRTSGLAFKFYILSRRLRPFPPVTKMDFRLLRSTFQFEVLTTTTK